MKTGYLNLILVLFSTLKFSLSILRCSTYLPQLQPYFMPLMSHLVSPTLVKCIHVFDVVSLLSVLPCNWQEAVINLHQINFSSTAACRVLPIIASARLPGCPFFSCLLPLAAGNIKMQILLWALKKLTAEEEGKELSTQLCCLGDCPHMWHGNTEIA